ncbi:hypothetical protein BV61_03980 [Candidatus Synechococcus spongiarum LMB bulk15M]|uniref:Uncharacterized protein n=1 Tax=Candidatus Synechococcus spongiarum LMB bulk15M TaxID=1943582 RepID=A0A1T1CZ41_9SYNE|nr:hypothetical protein BV61_03980 [Candidatus Synechococcus spongiarum LMB bulk15M]
MDDFFIVGGQKGYMDQKGHQFLTKNDKTGARLCVVFDSGVKTGCSCDHFNVFHMKDDAIRRISEGSQGPLFASCTEEGDETSSMIDVLPSCSELPDSVMLANPWL